MVAKQRKLFQTILEERKAKILLELQANKAELNALYESEPSDFVDHSAIFQNSYTGKALNNNLSEELKEIERALKKIASKEYGFCEHCSLAINEERLKIKPHAKYCIQCRKDIENEN